MKIQQLEYVIAIAEEGSITRAAKKLFQAQPNISTAVKELEQEMGIRLFLRTASGMVLTPEGERFVEKARGVIASMQALAQEYAARPEPHRQIHIAVAYSCYTVTAAAEALTSLPFSAGGFDVHIMENTTLRVLEDVCAGRSQVGVIRVPETRLALVKRQITDSGLHSRELMRFEYGVLLRDTHPLAQYSDVPYEQLAAYPEIVYGGEDLTTRREESLNPAYKPAADARRIVVYDRGTQISMMVTLPDAYLWSQPVPPHLQARMHAVLRPCSFAINRNYDLLIWRQNAARDPLIDAFVTLLTESAAQLQAFQGKHEPDSASE